MYDRREQHREVVLGLIHRFRRGDGVAAGQLVEELYGDLRRLAAYKMSNEPGGHSWQPTLLVHELYLQLTRLKTAPAQEKQTEAQEKEILLRLTGVMMQRRLIDHAKPRKRPMPSLDVEAMKALSSNSLDPLLAVEGLLQRLSEIDARLRFVVEARVFLAMTLPEIAEHLNCTERKVAAFWSFARQWLAEELDRECAA